MTIRPSCKYIHVYEIKNNLEIVRSIAGDEWGINKKGPTINGEISSSLADTINMFTEVEDRVNISFQNEIQKVARYKATLKWNCVSQSELLTHWTEWSFCEKRNQTCFISTKKRKCRVKGACYKNETLTQDLIKLVSIPRSL